MSKEVMEANQVEEVMEQQEPKEVKLPDNIQTKTKSGETLVMIATGNASYDKIYYSAAGQIFREKHVKLPVSLDGKKFDKVWDLFKYLTTEGNYRRVKK